MLIDLIISCISIYINSWSGGSCFTHFFLFSINYFSYLNNPALDAMTAAQLDNWLHTAWTKVNFNSINTAQMFFERKDFLRMVDLLLKSHLYGDKISYSEQITLNMVLEAFLSDTNIENTNTEEIIVENTNTENIIVENTNTEEIIIEDTNSGNIHAENLTRYLLELIVEDLEEIIIEDTNTDNRIIEDTNTEEIIIEDTNSGNIIIEDTNTDNRIIEDTNTEEIIIENTNSGNTFFNKLVEKPSSTVFGSLYSNPLFDSSNFLKKEGFVGGLIINSDLLNYTDLYYTDLFYTVLDETVLDERKAWLFSAWLKVDVLNTNMENLFCYKREFSMMLEALFSSYTDVDDLAYDYNLDVSMVLEAFLSDTNLLKTDVDDIDYDMELEAFLSDSDGEYDAFFRDTNTVKINYYDGDAVQLLSNLDADNRIIEDTNSENIIIEDTNTENIIIEDTNTEEIIIEDTNSGNIYAENLTRYLLEVNIEDLEEIIIENTNTEEIIIEDTNTENTFFNKLMAHIDANTTRNTNRNSPYVNALEEVYLSNANIENTNTEEIIIEDTNSGNIIIEDTNTENIIIEDTNTENIIIEDTNSGNTFFNKLVEKPSSTVFGSLYSNPLFDSSNFLKKEGILDIYDQYKYLKETTVFNNKYICYGGQLWERDLLNQQYFQRDAVIAGYIIRDSLLDFEELEYRFW